ncbi:protein transport protein Sec16B isoform X1 [Sus scrofa]|uniref:Protein transport protein sec16 n=1 Tax=Sus scrofa TaxID=9823 RepID=A0A8W4F920_PIG|nr:protein transport protein Sec16B isoform X1 [Sus scrofa]XP_020919351.1 protein transport protein Sec16B isoform X1 [Sus scrofa]XP_020919352.1 protein transport protein Sec16B isoform X1 [Sus scrofa]XP_020919353.1 protein transport protein Sec16B isoform X1 [Sus scrofa]XP_020919354.1 protein transport protein Sec16B isoform X1 [Sus scrofa]XP_020919355.1 protein transport protein Sec16B isoform X1 [Sus scrofa]XP_020919356.1 protein transport protein Sec16B isoform X1 [Sus scrofa]XP_02091935
MEPWVPQRPPQPRGRPPGSSKDPERGRWRDGYYWPVPYSWYNRERAHQRQDLGRSPQPQQDPRADQQQPHYASRPGEWHQPGSEADYYEGGYPSQFYLRPGTEDLYQTYHSPALREEYAYGSYYYHRHLQEERVPRQGSPYVWHEDYRDQKYLQEHQRANQKSPFAETQFQSKSQNPYKDSPASNSGQEEPGDLLPESLLTEAQKNKPSLTEESNLLRQHESGLSSSSYELSQYMANAFEPHDPTASTAWSPVQAEDVSAAGPKAPMKFYVPHMPVSFGPGGQLVCVGPSCPGDGETALVELHSMEVILNDSEEQEEMRTFPGPLVREYVHKVDIMTFCQQKAAQSRRSETQGSRDSALLWQLLVLLCRQNGSMVGSDIAELLMQDCTKLEKYKRQPPVANLISLTDEDWPVLSSGSRNLLTGEIPPSVDTPAQIMEKFTKLLYYGRKKEALEWAMKNHLWGHALFLASKMDSRTYSWVMSGFTSTLALNDPLQTLFQLMSGRIPQAATCCGDKQWGDWRPHLAVILSNQGGDPELYQRTIVTMGDTLAGKGLVEAAHFCYLMAHVPFGYYTVKTDHLALLGSSHSQEFLKFATTEAIQRTEIFEYCQMLGRPKSFIPSFQVYKLLYASRLADYGLASQALHYCEAIGTALLSQGESSHPVLLVELIKLAERLKLSDPLVLERHRRPGDRELEPDWLLHLRGRHKELQQKGAGDTGDPHPARLDISGARKTTEHTFYQDLSGQQGNSEALGGCSAQWPTPEQTGPAQLSPQQPFALQPSSYPAGGGSQQTGVPVPLYEVPETHLPGTLGSVAVTGAPGERAWEEAQQMHPPPGENTVVSSETFQPPDGQKVVFKPQVPQLPRARRVSESSAVSDKDDEEGSSDEADKKSSQSTAQRERPGEAKENTKSSGFGWFSWFRSKPTNNASPSGDEDSSDSPDSEQETPRASSPTQPVLGLPPTPAPEPQTLPGTSAFSSDEGGGEVRGSASSEGTAEGPGHGGLSGPEGVPSEPYFSSGILLPPPP